MQKLKDIYAGIVAGLVLLTFVAGLVGLKACEGQVMYNDWRCGFSQCRRLVP